MRKFAVCLSFLFLLALIAYGVKTIRDESPPNPEAGAENTQTSGQGSQGLQRKAEKGDVDAQFALGIVYDTGEFDVPQDYAKAAFWFQKDAEKGHSLAQFDLGRLYYYGTGVPQDYARAIQWFQKSAEKEFPPAQYYLGLMYAQGKGVQEDDFEAAKWLQKAAEQGQADAQGMLGALYLIGSGVILDEQKGCGLIRSSAEQGNRDAIEAYNKLCAKKFLSSSPTTQATEGQTGEVDEAPWVGPVMVEFKPFIVNLSDVGGRRMMKLTMSAEADTQELADEINAKMGHLRDTILLLLSDLKSDDFSGLEGKQKVKNEMLKRINPILTKGNIKNLYFSEIVVQ